MDPEIRTLPEAEAAPAEEVPVRFSDFDLDERLLSALDAEGFEKPTPIQARMIPIALEGRDCIGIAQTGTGKTLAFGLPGLSRMAQGPAKRNAMLVLAPTRELAQQGYEVLAKFGRPLHLRAMTIYGGVGFHQQIDKLKNGREIIVATPGRLLDHLERGNIKFPELDLLCLDEADRMLDMGFLPDIKAIMRYLPKERQTIMCSATWPDEIQRMCAQFMHEPEKISVGAVSKPVDKVRQLLYPVYAQDKTNLLMRIIDETQMDSAVIFVRTKDRTMQLARMLNRKGYPADEIHGDRTQKQRDKSLRNFKEGRSRLLVATDVAARGLDIDSITHVINYDIPENPEDYIHRIGRTARAEAEGDAITFVTPQEHEALYGIEKTLGMNLPRAEWENAPPVLSTWQPPEVSRRSRSGRRGLTKRSSKRLLR